MVNKTMIYQEAKDREKRKNKNIKERKISDCLLYTEVKLMVVVFAHLCIQIRADRGRQ